MNRIFNFSSGPSMIPEPVIKQAQNELCNWNNLGYSIMEISHRNEEFINMIEKSEQDLRELLNIPSYYKVLFCHGGARAQFAAVPMNLLGGNDNIHVDYIHSGYWSYSAMQEAQKYCIPQTIDVIIKDNNELYSVKPMSTWNISSTIHNNYVHYCPNETLNGLAINELPDFGNKTIVADFSSTILSYPLDVTRFGLIYASAQKNMGTAGITLVIIREDLLGRTCKILPSMLNYSILAKNHSMFNTPPTFAWYLVGLVLKWLKKQGGLTKINDMNRMKADLLYTTIDESDFYNNNISLSNRSLMNVSFQLRDAQLNDLFLREAKKAGLYGLKGHKAIGGMRASLYNAMPLIGVRVLVDFMKTFMKNYG